MLLSTSSSLGFGRSSGTNTTFLGYKNSNYSILENYRSGIGEWNSIIGSSDVEQPDRRLHDATTRAAATSARCSRSSTSSTAPASPTRRSASEPFTPNNELRYNTFQLQDSFTKFANRHSLTFGASVEKYHSENVFFPGKQSAYVYNSLSDFYTDLQWLPGEPEPDDVAGDAAALPGALHATSPGRRSRSSRSTVWYIGRLRAGRVAPAQNVTITAGVRVDVADVRRHGLRATPTSMR